jgi:hypothetical protein
MISSVSILSILGGLGRFEQVGGSKCSPNADETH